MPAAGTPYYAAVQGTGWGLTRPDQAAPHKHSLQLYIHKSKLTLPTGTGLSSLPRTPPVLPRPDRNAGSKHT